MRICTPYLNTYCCKWDGRWLDGKLGPIRSWCNQVWCEKLRRFRARFVSASVLKIAVGAKENFVCDCCIYLGVCGWLQMLSFYPPSLLAHYWCLHSPSNASCRIDQRTVVQKKQEGDERWFKYPLQKVVLNQSQHHLKPGLELFRHEEACIV